MLRNKQDHYCTNISEGLLAFLDSSWGIHFAIHHHDVGKYVAKP